MTKPLGNILGEYFDGIFSMSLYYIPDTFQMSLLALTMFYIFICGTHIFYTTMSVLHVYIDQDHSSFISVLSSHKFICQLKINKFSIVCIYGLSSFRIHNFFPLFFFFRCRIISNAFICDLTCMIIEIGQMVCFRIVGMSHNI